MASMNVLQFAFAMLIVVIFNAILLWKWKGLSSIQATLYLYEEHAITMCLQQAWLLLTEFCLIHVACALDLTFKFAWLGSDAPF